MENLATISQILKGAEILAEPHIADAATAGHGVARVRAPVLHAIWSPAF